MYLCVCECHVVVELRDANGMNHLLLGNHTGLIWEGFALAEGFLES